MPRRGRAASPPPAAAPAPRAAAPPPPAAAPAPPPPAATAPVPVAAAPTAVAAPAAAAPQGPGLMAQMAATAGGVAIGSTVGHVAGAGITSLFSGGSSTAAAPAPAAAAPPAPVAQPAAAAAPAGPSNATGPCAFEIKQFVECAQGQPDITLCQGFNEAVKECKARGAMVA